MLKGVKILKKAAGQSQEEFKDKVCEEYIEFFEEFILEDGKYTKLYSTVIDSLTENARYIFKSKTGVFVRKIVNFVVDVARIKREAPVPDLGFFRGLYFVIEKPNQSKLAFEEVINDFDEGFSNLMKQGFLAYDTVFPNPSSNGVRLLKREEGQSISEFCDNVRGEYIDFFHLFIVDGIYCDLYNNLLKNKEMEQKVRDSQLLLATSDYNITEAAEARDALTVPDLAYFRALYYKSFSTKKKDIEQVTKNFISACNELYRRMLLESQTS